jgi:hypothetical protein
VRGGRRGGGRDGRKSSSAKPSISTKNPGEKILRQFFFLSPAAREGGWPLSILPFPSLLPLGAPQKSLSTREREREREREKEREEEVADHRLSSRRRKRRTTKVRQQKKMKGKKLNPLSTQNFFHPKTKNSHSLPPRYGHVKTLINAAKWGIEAAGDAGSRRACSASRRRSLRTFWIK